MARKTGARDSEGGGFGRRDALKMGAAAAVLAWAPAALAQGNGRVSRLGEYRGYSEERYDGWQRTSLYVPVRDGTRLAVDLFRPTAAGRLHEGPLPVVWIPKRYQRAVVQRDGTIRSAMSTEWSRVERKLIKHGYIIASVDRRGTGSSFGTRSEFSDPIDARDGYDITEWFAQQPWSTDRIGMCGASYEGEMQLRVAGLAPPHLKAIMPEVAPFDWYWIAHPGGLYRPSFGAFATSVGRQDVDPNNAPVDVDSDHALLTQALAQHGSGNDYAACLGRLPCRDSAHPVTGAKQWLERHGGAYAEGLSRSGIAVYHRVGWFAGVLVDQLAWYVNQTSGPKKMLIGPWGGRGLALETEHELWNIEALRFYDYWLKGVQNGIMHEPPIHSSVPSSHVRVGTAWRGLQQWPLPNERRTNLFFAAGPSGSVRSTNDGLLGARRPRDAQGADEYRVITDLAYGPTTPLLPTDPVLPGVTPANHASFDERALTYTTEPLDQAMEVTGHAVARIWLSSSAADGAFFVKLQDVDPAGASSFVADGMLRATHRVVADPPYNYFGAPWIRSFAADVRDMPIDEPVELVITLSPTSYIFQQGHRIRVTIAGSDTAIGPSPALDTPPLIKVHRNRVHRSRITLPVIPRTA